MVCSRARACGAGERTSSRKGGDGERRREQIGAPWSSVERGSEPQRRACLQRHASATGPDRRPAQPQVDQYGRYGPNPAISRSAQLPPRLRCSSRRAPDNGAKRVLGMFWEVDSGLGDLDCGGMRGFPVLAVGGAARGRGGALFPSASRRSS